VAQFELHDFCAFSGFRLRGLQPRNRSPYDLVSPRAVLICTVRAKPLPLQC
jgi:hypothetical protein